MKDFKNIEELFRENLSGFEVDPGAGVWESIAQNLPAQGAAAGGSAATGAATKMAMWKLVAGVAVISTGIGITAGYFYSENKNETNKKTAEKNETVISDKTIDLSKQKEAVENTAIEVKESDLQQNDVIVKDQQKNKTIIVSVKENPKFNMNKSSVDTWITKRTNYTANNNSTSVYEAVKTETNTTVEPVTVEVKEIDQSKPLASIKRSVAGGPVPLTVTLSNSTDEKHYEWTIDNYNEKIKDPSLTHIFEVPGTYKISLTVKDDKGNKSTDEVEITVGEPLKTEATEKEKSKVETYGINVFSPNNDNINDYFFFETENVESFLLQVMDRSGNIYFETNDSDFKWDGTLTNGEIIKEGTYFYYYNAVGKDGQLYKDFKSLEIKTKR